MTLAERMSGGLLPVTEALELAMTLAESLRLWHDDGRIHGEITPATLRVNGGALELTPPAPGPAAPVTPYTAPEILRGRKPDPRADIFAFGAIVFEMLTGRRAFEGTGPASLAANLVNAPA